MPTVWDAVNWVAIGFLMLSLFTGIFAFLHVTGVRKLPPPTDKWIVGTFFFGIIASCAVAVKKALETPTRPQPITLACDSTVPAVFDANSFNTAMKSSNCRSQIVEWTKPHGLFTVTDPTFVDAIAAQLPKRTEHPTEIGWRNAIASVVQGAPALRTLRQRASERESPFLSELAEVDIGKPQQFLRGSKQPGEYPAKGQVYVSSKQLDNQLLILIPEGRGNCKLILRAKYALTNVPDRDPPLLHINPAQEHYLFGKELTTTTTTIAIAQTNVNADSYDPSRTQGC